MKKIKFLIVLFLILLLANKYVCLNESEQIVLKNDFSNPLFIKGNQNYILFLHGFGATCQEVNYIADNINKKGYTVESILLKGHGKSPLDFRNTSIAEMKDQVKNKLLSLKGKYKNIYLCGFSMGGMITLNLYDIDFIQKFITISPGFYIKNKELYDFPVNILIKGLYYIIPYSISKPGTFVYNNENVQRDTYSKYPLNRVADLMNIAYKTKKILKNIEKPFLIIHAKDDKTIDYRGSVEIYDNISSANKKIILLDKGDHRITMNDQRDKVSKEIISFLKGNQQLSKTIDTSNVK